MQKLKIMDATGHSVIEFDKADPASMKLVQDKIAELTRQGTRFAKTVGEGQHELLDAGFDPVQVDTDIISIPHLHGG